MKLNKISGILARFFLIPGLLVTVLISIAGAGVRTEKPLFLSYEQRLILTYLIAGADESEEKQMEVADRFEKTFRKYSNIPAVEVKVSSFQEFLNGYKGNWPNSFSVESDLSLIENGELKGPVTFKAIRAQSGNEDPRLQAQIDGFIARQVKDIRDGSENYLQAGDDSRLAEANEMVRNLRTQWKQGSLTSAATKRQWILRGFGKASELLHAQTKVIQSTGEKMAQSDKIKSQDQAMTLFLQTVFKEYFGRLSSNSKKQIISQFLGNDLHAEASQKFEIMVLNSGPQFQKLLQVVARDAGIGEDLLQIFKKLESKANPIPAPIVKALFEAERERYQWISYETQALGTGTMAQVHLGKINSSRGEEQVVIRFLKPEIEKRVEEDHRILTEIAPIMDGDPRFKQAGFPKLAPVISDLNKTVTDELDLEATKERQMLGKKVYTRQMFFNGATYKNVIELEVPAIFEGQGGGVSKLMVQELATGTKLDKQALMYKDVAPDMKKILIEEISKVWIDEVLFKSGFFHSDLHQGNFLVFLTDPAFKVNILDFGMGGTISRETQLDMLLLGAGLELNRAEVVTETLWSLSEKNNNVISKLDFKAAVQERMQKIQTGKMAFQTMDQWTAWALDEGLRFPYEFVSMNRGIAILDKSLKDAGSSLTTTEIGRRLASRSARVILFDLRAKGLLSWVDLFKLGWASAGQAKPATVEVKPAGLPAALTAKVRCNRLYSNAKTGSVFDGAAMMLFDGLLSF